MRRGLTFVDPPRDPDKDAWSGRDGQTYCYLTTVGRRTGRPHTIEIWFALRGSTLYMLSGGGDRSDWIRNILESPEVAVRIGRERFSGRARVVSDAGEDREARDRLIAKYTPRYGGDLSGWRARAVPVAVDLVPADADGRPSAPSGR